LVKSKRYGSKVQLNNLKNGDISYFIVYKINSKTIYKKVGQKSEGITERKAFELRNKIISENRHGMDLSQKSSRFLSFDKLAEIYFTSNEYHNKSNKKYQQMYKKHIQPSLGDVAVARLDDSLIYELQALKKADGKSESTINIIVKLIRRIIGFSVKQGIIDHNPFRNIKLFKINNTRLRYLDLSEIDELRQVISGNSVLEIFVGIALSTGARANSILSLQKKDINIENKSITLQDFKRNNTYVGYADHMVWEKIVQHIDKFPANGYVCSENGKKTKYHIVYTKLRKVFERFNRGLEADDRINRVVIHTLRHTFASHLAINGVSIQEIQKLMNHQDIKQTLKYAKLMPESGRKYIENLYKEE